MDSFIQDIAAYFDRDQLHYGVIHASIRGLFCSRTASRWSDFYEGLLIILVAIYFTHEQLHYWTIYANVCNLFSHIKRPISRLYDNISKT